MITGKGQGRNVHARSTTDALQPEFTTLSKDGKPVWEPGLPAEVTSRRIHKPAKKEAQEEAPISCDLRSTLKLPPGARADWLDKALRALPSGRTKVHDVFNVVTHPKFVLGVPERIGRRMLHRVAESLDAFSDKQRTTLVAKCKLAELFQSGAGGDGDDYDDGDEDALPKEPATAPPPLPEERPPRLPRDRSRSRSRRRRSHSREEGRSRRSRSARRRQGQQASSANQASASRETQAAARERAEATRREESPPMPAPQKEKEMSPEEKAAAEQAFLERQRQREEERKKMEADRRAFEERERKRKAKLGSAFLVGGEEEDEGPMSRLHAPLMVRRGPGKAEDMPYAEAGLAHIPPPAPMNDRPRTQLQPVAAGLDPRFVEAMGGDKILAEAHQILQNAAESGRLAPIAEHNAGQHSPTRKKKRSRSRSTRRPDVRSSGSYRSPTPDGRARGQARAARKAKMIASLMGMPSNVRP